MSLFLDYNATTPVDKRVISAMESVFLRIYGNPSSRDHTFGWDASEAVEEARSNVANLIHATPNEIIFTSGATESINLALKGVVRALKRFNAGIATCATEHDAVLATCRQLHSTRSVEVQFLSVDNLGHPDQNAFESFSARAPRALVAIMLANNEIGTTNDVRPIGETIHKLGGILVCDLAQAIGKVPVDVHLEGIDLAAFSSHKMYGPKGVGALFVRNGFARNEIEPLICGGGQEHGLRGGTLNVPGIVGFGEACRIAATEMEDEANRTRQLRDRLEQALLAELPDVWINGDTSNRIPNTSNMGFRGIDARTLIRDMHDIAVSTQAACSSGSTGPSHVLKAIGLTDDEAYSCIRFSLGRFTTEEEIDYTIHKVITSVRKLRRIRSVAG